MDDFAVALNAEGPSHGRRRSRGQRWAKSSPGWLNVVIGGGTEYQRNIIAERIRGC
jgi:hypothetical protein